jgi:hypothetical protein
MRLPVSCFLLLVSLAFFVSSLNAAPVKTWKGANWYGRDDESDVTGRVWKVSYTGADKPKVTHSLDSPKWKDQAYALSALASPSHLIREKAIRALAARGPTIAKALGDHAATCKSPLGAAGAI